MGINGIEVLKDEPKYYHLYPSFGRDYPKVGEVRVALCGLTLKIPTREYNLVASLCPRCDEISQELD
jgi:hypothetical protein